MRLTTLAHVTPFGSDLEPYAIAVFTNNACPIARGMIP